MFRSPYEGYVSLFVKRYGIDDPFSFSEPNLLRNSFKLFLKDEVLSPHEAPCRWADHVGQAVNTFGPDAVIHYTTDLSVMEATLSARIASLEGNVDVAKLSAIIQAPHEIKLVTTRTSHKAKLFDWYDQDARAVVAEEVKRLKREYPATRALNMKETFE